MEEARKREWSYTNRVIWKACISTCLAKWKVVDNVTIQIVWWNWKESGKLFIKKYFYVMGFSLPHEVVDIFLYYWETSNNLFLFTLNTSHCKELQGVSKSSLAVIAMGFLCLAALPPRAPTENHVYSGFNLKHWLLWYSGF